MTMSSIDSRPTEPCSQSISTQSKPIPAADSTICGEGIITESPNAGSPAAKRSFILLVCMFFPFRKRRLSPHARNRACDNFARHTPR